MPCPHLVPIPTSFSVTNSASSPTRSPAWGISLSMRGMKVAWHLRCLRASEASARSTLASMGFLTVQGKGKELSGAAAAPAPPPLPRRALTDEVVLGVEVPPGVVEDGWHLPAHVKLHGLALQRKGERSGATWVAARGGHGVTSVLTLSTGSMRKSLKRYHCWCVTPWGERHSLRGPPDQSSDSSAQLPGKAGCDSAMWEPPPFLGHRGEIPAALGGDRGRERIGLDGLRALPSS